MRLGMIGAGRMGANMSRRLRDAGHQVVLTDVDPDALTAMSSEGFDTAASLEELVGVLERPRALWIMIPAAFVGATVDTLAPILDPGDVVVDGGNSWYRHAIDRAQALATSGIQFVDVGTSGGVYGLERGFCLMIGGEPEAVGRLEPVLEALAPGVEGAPRTAGRTGDPTAAEHGYLHCGPPGAGHFVKMVHNGIEYGLMAAYAEGLNLLHHADEGFGETAADAESTPLRDPVAYQYRLPVAEIAEVWRRGSVIGSWLLDLTAHALSESPSLDEFEGRVSDSGEGRWTVQAAIDVAVPIPVIASSLFSRFSSRDRSDFGDRVLSALRKEFGGHVEKRAAGGAP